MATRIEQKYPVYVETAILNIDKAKEVFPSTSNFSTYSTVNQTDGKYFSSDLMYSLRKNRSEIPMAFYRNGILSEFSLENFLENNKLYVKPGEYRLRGENLYHGYDSFANYSTEEDSETQLSIDDPFIYFYSNARINFLSSYVYKRENGRLTLVTSPKDQGAVSDPVNTDKYIGYDFADSSQLTDLIVNNYVQKEEDTVLKFKASAPDASTVWLNGNFHLLCEYLGEAKGTPNQVFKTKYFPISGIGTKDSDFSDNLTHIGVVSSDGSTWDFYQIFDSYQAALAASSDEYSCYVDRYTGRIYFSRQALTLPEDIEYIVGNGTIAGGGVAGQTISIAGKDWNYLEDDGAIQLSLDGINFETVRFQKVTQNKIQITTPEDNYSGDIRIYPTDYFAYPTGKVYAFYTTVIGFEKEVNSSSRKMTEKEIQPWLWVGQKTIAVLSKDKVFPAKITLRALDMPLARRSGNSLVYGPLYSGAEIAILEGEVLSYDNEPIVNQEVTIYIKQGPGLINGSKSITAITNDDGKFYINYYPQDNAFTFLKFKDGDITYQGAKTILSVNQNYNDLDILSLGSSQAEKCILYAILKDDGSIGTTGKRHVLKKTEYEDYAISGSLGVIEELPNRLLNLGSGAGIVFTDFLRDDEVGGYEGGQVTVFDPSLGEYVSVKIKDIVKAPDYWWDGSAWDIPDENAKQSTYVILLDINDSSIYETITSFDAIWIKRKDDIAYDASLLNGRKCILSELKYPPKTDWKHPNVEGNSSVYGPIMTSYYNGIQKKFTVESVLPVSSSTDAMIDIAGYALIPEKSVLIEAYTTSEDDRVYSNNIEFEIELNNRDKGVVENILKTFKVPYGFRLVGAGDDSSSTISTATFLTVNKVSGATPNTATSKYPLISKIGVNGIIYLDNANEETAYQPGSSSVKFTISAD